MSDSIKGKVSDYYTSKLEQFGATPRGVDWNSEESQFLRFDQLTKVLPDQNVAFSLLDYGCGFGSLLQYLQPRYSKMSYTGFDISEKMIESSREKFRGADAEWIFSEKDLRKVNFVIASGIFNVRMDVSAENWLKYILETLTTINSLADAGFSFNILTSYSDKEYMKDNLYYADPCFFFDYCKRNFSPRVAILHDYPLYEFSVIVRK